MALILPKNYHKVAAIERNGISWIEPELAERQDIRPLRIGIINISHNTITHSIGLCSHSKV